MSVRLSVPPQHSGSTAAATRGYCGDAASVRFGPSGRGPTHFLLCLRHPSRKPQRHYVTWLSVRPCVRTCLLSTSSLLIYLNDSLTDAASNDLIVPAEVERPIDNNVPVERPSATTMTTTTTTATTTSTTHVTPDYYIINTPPSYRRPSIGDRHPPRGASFEPARPPRRRPPRPRPATSTASPPPRRRWPPRRGRYPPTRHRYGRRPPYRSAAAGGRHAAASTILAVVTLVAAYNCMGR